MTRIKISIFFWRTKNIYFRYSFCMIKLYSEPFVLQSFCSPFHECHMIIFNIRWNNVNAFYCCANQMLKSTENINWICFISHSNWVNIQTSIDKINQFRIELVVLSPTDFDIESLNFVASSLNSNKLFQTFDAIF